MNKNLYFRNNIIFVLINPNAMKRVLKFLGIIILVVIVAIAGVLTYIVTAFPKVKAAPAMKIVATPEMLKRGSYLANCLCLCVDCHSQRDFTKFGGPLVAGTIGQGGEPFDHSVGFPGSFYARNITPYNLGTWTDGEIYRAITTGVDKDGKPLFPVMPYQNYGKLDTNDIKAVIAYIRTLPAVKNDVPQSKADFPMNVIMHTIPQEATPQVMPAKGDAVAYGKYIATAASCIDCHTRSSNGKFVGELFAGDFEFHMPDGSTIRSANITPDKETGIGMWTKEIFLAKFKMFADSNYHAPTVKTGQANTLMPWDNYSKMDSSDLTALFAYLQTVKPVKQQVTHYSPPQEK
jgi:cbb3-type cytochrome oxidase cytochrome c subunit